MHNALPRRVLSRGRVCAIGPFVVTLALALWQSGRPSYWRDESVSVVIGSSSFTQIQEFLRQTDAVHGVYYLFLHGVTALGGTGEVVTRLPSALGAAAAAAGIALLGRRLLSPAVGLYAGLIYAVLPIVSEYAQEVRQYALVSAGAVLVAHLLVSALETPAARAGRYAAYGVAMGLLGWLHLYALFLLSAHGVTALLWRHAPERRKRHLVMTGAAMCTALAMVVPLVRVAKSQERGQVSWLKRPDHGVVRDFAVEIAQSRFLLAVLVSLVVVGAAAMLVEGRRSKAAVVILPWLVLPFAFAVAISQIHPVYHPRYVLYTVVAVALAAGVGLDRITSLAQRSAMPNGTETPVVRRTWRKPAARTFPVGIPVLVLVVLAISGIPQQQAIRGPRSKPDDLRSMAGVLAERARPGDAVLFVPVYRQSFVTVYEGAFRRLNSTVLHPGGDEELPTDRFRSVLKGLTRIWVIDVPPPGNRYRTRLPVNNRAVLSADEGLTEEGSWRFGKITLRLMVRTGASGPAEHEPGSRTPPSPA